MLHACNGRLLAKNGSQQSPVHACGGRPVSAGLRLSSAYLMCKAQYQEVEAPEQQPSRAKAFASPTQQREVDKVKVARLRALGLQPGDIVQGAVIGIQSYGVFLNLDGVTALLNVWQISHDTVTDKDMRAIFKIGDTVKALVLSVDVKAAKVDLSTKVLEATPGDMMRNKKLVFDGAERMADEYSRREAARQDGQVEAKKQRLLDSGIQAGDVLQGNVLWTQTFGAFLDLSGNFKGSVQSLLHISNISHTLVKDANPLFEIGDTVKVLVKSTDLKAGTLVLSTQLLEPSPGDMLRDKQLVFDKAEETGAAWRAAALAASERRRKRNAPVEIKAGDVVQGTVVWSQGVGALIDLGRVQTFMHVRHISHAHVSNASTVLFPGEKIKALVLYNNLETNMLELSTKLLEPSPGDMLRDKQLVFDNAEETALATGIKEGAAAVKRKEEKAKRVLALGLKEGALVQATVLSTSFAQTILDLGEGLEGLLLVHRVSEDFVEGKQMVSLFKKGDSVKAIVYSLDSQHERVMLSTKHLEATPGDMRRNPQMVYAGAEAKVAAYESSHKNILYQKNARKDLRRKTVLLAVQKDNAASQEVNQDRVPDVTELQNRQRLEALGIKEGAVVSGSVQSVQADGVTVDLGDGMTGRLHHSHIESEEPLKTGDELKVLVLACNAKRMTVQLGTKQLKAMTVRTHVTVT